MAALLANRSTRRYGAKVWGLYTLPVADNVHIYEGAQVGINSSGYAVPMTATTGLQIAGCAQAEADNTVSGHSAGGITVDVWSGDYLYDIGTAGDALTAGNFGALVYAIDDHTVGAVATGRSLAGILVGIDSSNGLAAAQAIVRQFVGARQS